MPIYEYLCEACGHKLEKMQKISDTPLTDCPSCAESRLRKLVSAAGFRLKGSGWYETDFKSGSRRNVLESESSGGSDAGGGSSDAGNNKNDSKSDTGSDPKSDSVPVAAG